MLLIMAELFYKDERNRDFYRACESVRAENNSRLHVIDIVAQAILKPASSFFLHPKEYANIIRDNGQSLPKNSIKRELHLEILKRYQALKEIVPNSRPHEAAKIISEQSAPRFYLSHRRAVDLYYILLKSNPE